MLNNLDASGVPFFNLSIPPQIYQLVAPLVRPSWLSDQQIEGLLVRLYRDYVEGRQRSFLTAKQRKMLNIKNPAVEQFFINYCSMVVEIMAERLTVTTIEGDAPAATAWADQVLAFNRFNALQMDSTEATLRDAASYVMIAYDNEAKKPTLSMEPAFDGYLGIIPIYDRMLRQIVAAVKVWYENSNFRRFNIYWPDRVEKYIEMSAVPTGGEVVPGVSQQQALGEQAGTGSSALYLGRYVDPASGKSSEPWLDRDGNPLGVPIVPFRNRWKAHRTTGISELAPVITLQDGLNRAYIDTLMTSSLTAFQLKFALGFKPPNSVAPGDWIIAGEEGVPSDQKVDVKVLEQGQIVPFVSQMNFLIDQIATISRTPLPDYMGGDSSSGEALKQREVGLLSKVERFKVKAGDNWADVMAYAARLEKAFGSSDYTKTVWRTHWADSQVRNDPETIQSALALQPLIGDEETLRLVAPIHNWDEAKIQQIQAAKAKQKADQLSQLALPGFAQFGKNLSSTERIASQYTA